MKTHRILLIPGDGIGPELAPLARDLVEALEAQGVVEPQPGPAPAVPAEPRVQGVA